MGAALEIVTDKSPEGSQFVRGFGGVGGLLRYRVDLQQLDQSLLDELDTDFDLDDYWVCVRRCLVEKDSCPRGMFFRLFFIHWLLLLGDGNAHFCIRIAMQKSPIDENSSWIVERIVADVCWKSLTRDGMIVSVTVAFLECIRLKMNRSILWAITRDEGIGENLFADMHFYSSGTRNGLRLFAPSFEASYLKITLWKTSLNLKSVRFSRRWSVYTLQYGEAAPVLRKNLRPAAPLATLPFAPYPRGVERWPLQAPCAN